MERANLTETTNKKIKVKKTKYMYIRTTEQKKKDIGKKEGDE